MNRLTKTAAFLLSASAFTLTGCEGEDVLAFGAGLGIFGIILAIVLFIMVIWAVVDIFSKPYPLPKKLVWLLVIFFIPYIGAILYFVMGRKDTVSDL